MRLRTKIITADVLAGLAQIADGSVHCCCTSPPYWGLRDYGVEGQIGLEPTPDAFIAKMVEVFAEVRRVLRKDGTLWLNLGDSYAGSWGAQSRGPTTPGTLEGAADQFRRQIAAAARIGAGTGSLKRTPGIKAKDLCMIPWRVALALQADGWYLRSSIVWAKKSPMPESVRDRPTSSWEPIFLLAKSERYYYDAEAVKEPCGAFHAGGKNNGLNSPKVPDPRKKQDALGKQTYTGFNARWSDNPVATRSQRNVWHLGPEPYAQAHFATFPTEIPRRAILAGTSEKGCCPECGAGWVRVVERTNMVIKPSGRDGRIAGNGMRSTSGAMVEPPTSKTIAWSAGCECNAGEPIPATVLDPFLGSGTTLAVAGQLGRHGVGIELNPEYVKLAKDRIGKAMRPHTHRSERAEESPLFGGDR